MDPDKKLRTIFLAIALITQGSTAWTEVHSAAMPPSNPAGHNPASTRSDTHWEDLTDLPELPSSCSALGYSTPHEAHSLVHFIRYGICNRAFQAWRMELEIFFRSALQHLHTYSALEGELRSLRSDFLRRRQQALRPPSLPQNQRRPFYIPRAQSTPSPTPEDLEIQARLTVLERLERRLPLDDALLSQRGELLDQITREFLETGDLLLCGGQQLRVLSLRPYLFCGTVQEWQNLDQAFNQGTGPPLSQIQNLFNRASHMTALQNMARGDIGLLPIHPLEALGAPSLTTDPTNNSDLSALSERWNASVAFCSPYLDGPNRGIMAHLHRNTNLTPPPALFAFHRAALQEAQQHCSLETLFRSHRALNNNPRFVADLIAESFGLLEQETPDHALVNRFCSFVGRTRRLDSCNLSSWCEQDDDCREETIIGPIAAFLEPLPCQDSSVDFLTLAPSNSIEFAPLTEHHVDQYRLPGRTCFDAMASRSAGRSRMYTSVAQCLGSRSSITLIDTGPSQERAPRPGTSTRANPQGSQRVYPLSIDFDTRNNPPGAFWTEQRGSTMRWESISDPSWQQNFLALPNGISFSADEEDGLPIILIDSNGSNQLYRREAVQNAQHFANTLRRVCRESISRHRTPPQRLAPPSEEPEAEEAEGAEQ